MLPVIVPVAKSHFLQRRGMRNCRPDSENASRLSILSFNHGGSGFMGIVSD